MTNENKTESSSSSGKPSMIDNSLSKITSMQPTPTKSSSESDDKGK